MLQEPKLRTRLLAALRSGDPDGLRQLLSSGADLNSPGWVISLSKLELRVPSYPLIWAVDMDKPKVVRMLLDSGADPNIFCEYVHESRACWLRPLCHATNLDIVTMLLDAGADVNAKQQSRTMTETALLLSSRSQPSISGLLIERGADVNVTDRSGCTALYRSIFHKHHDLAARLIQVR